MNHNWFSDRLWGIISLPFSPNICIISNAKVWRGQGVAVSYPIAGSGEQPPLGFMTQHLGVRGELWEENKKCDQSRENGNGQMRDRKEKKRFWKSKG